MEKKAKECRARWMEYHNAKNYVDALIGACRA
jgi:hypothetical protein